ncbi:unnamed protein product [Prunus armeniaca]
MTQHGIRAIDPRVSQITHIISSNSNTNPKSNSSNPNPKLSNQILLSNSLNTYFYHTGKSFRYISLPINGGSSTSPPQIVTIQSDNSPLPTGINLTVTNYALWSQVMEMRIATSEKLGYLTDDTPNPHELSFTYNKWCTENFRVKVWLIDSMSPNLMSRFIRFSTPEEIWAAIKKNYYDGGYENFILFISMNERSPLNIMGEPIHKYYSQL